MLPLVWCFSCCVLIYLAITRIFPQCLRWIIKRCYHVEARIGRIGIPYMTLHDVQLSTNGFTIEIDQIGFRSSFLSSEVSKLVNVVIHDMRINKDMVSGSRHSNWRPPETFDDVRIPPLVITIAQFVSVRVVTVTLAVVSHSLVLHATLAEVSTDASVVHSTKSLLASLSLASSTARLLSVSGRVHVSAASLNLEASLVATTPLVVQNVSLSVGGMKTVIDDDFFPNIERKQKKEGEGITEKKAEILQLVNKAVSIIPKKLSVTFDNCIITDATDRDMTTLQKFLINTTFKPSARKYCGLKGNVGLSFSLEGLDMRSATDTQLVLKLLEFNSTLGEEGLVTQLMLQDFSTLYDHDKMNWLSQFMPQADDRKVSEKKNWWPDINVKAKFEFWNVSTALRMPNLSPAAIGFNHLKFTYDSSLNNQTKSGELWEVLLESVWCQLAKFGGPGNLRKEHTWGTAVAAGLVLVKSGMARSSALLDTVRLELSPPLADILMPLLSMLATRLSKQKAKPLMNSTKQKVINVSLANTNVFFIANKKVCLMLRVDTAGVESSLPVKLCLEAEGIRFSSISPVTPTFLCVRSSDIKGWSGNLELIRAEWNKSMKFVTVKVFRQLQFQWNPNLHLKILEICHIIRDFIKGVKNEDEQTQFILHPDRKPMSINVAITGHVKIVLKVSKLHFFTVSTDDFQYSKSGDSCSWSTSLIKMAVDNADIFSIEGLSFSVLEIDQVSWQHHSVYSSQVSVNLPVFFKDLQMNFPP